MKHFNVFYIAYCVLIVSILCTAQTDTLITSLHGFEDNYGHTQLFYQAMYHSLNSDIDTIQNNIFHFNTSSDADSVYLDNYIIHLITPLPPFDTLGVQIVNYFVFDKDPQKYIYAYNGGPQLKQCAISRYDLGETFRETGHISFFYASSNNPQNVFAVFNKKLLKSTDGGKTWPSSDDSSNINLEFFPLAFSPFNDNIIFGFDSVGNLIKSFDQGKTFLL